MNLSYNIDQIHQLLNESKSKLSFIKMTGNNIYIFKIF
jgi:hypothetical protein